MTEECQKEVPEFFALFTVLLPNENPNFYLFLLGNLAISLPDIQDFLL